MSDRSPLSDTAPSPGQEATKDRILDAAERLFSEHGFAATSTRAITQEAGVNLAAVNYHFGSKDALIFDLLERRVHRLNSNRYRLLDEAEARHQPEAAPLEEILESLFRPCLDMVEDKQDHDFLQLLARSMYEHPEANKMLAEREWVPLARRFTEAVLRARPELSEADVGWRLLFAVGGMVHAAVHGPAIHLYTDGKIGWSTRDEVLNELIRFTSAGFRSPSTL